MAIPSTASNDARTRMVMSVNYIAPADSAPGYQPPSEECRSLHVETQRGWTPQAQADSKGPNSMFERQDSGWDRSSQGSPRSATVDLDPATPTLSTSVSSDSGRMLARRREDDRHNYDDEEKYAILYFRIERGEKWSDILKNFRELFPTGHPRRTPGKALTKLYVERRKGGLECRYYRLREDHGFKQLRSPSYDLDDDRRKLAMLLMTLDLSESFLVRLRSL